MIRSSGSGNLRAVVNVPTKGEMQSFSARLTAVRDLTYDVRQIDLALLDPAEMRFTVRLSRPQEVRRMSAHSLIRVFASTRTPFAPPTMTRDANPRNRPFSTTPTTRSSSR